MARTRWIFLSLLAGILLASTICARVNRLHRPARQTSAVPIRMQPPVPLLRIDSVVQHGHIAEIKGTTDPGVTVMINGERAAVVFDGNQFHHFVGPLLKGTTILSVTCQNEEGGTVTQKLAVAVE